MLGMKKQPQSQSRIGAGMKVTGDCIFQGELQVDGTVLGNVVAADDGARSTLVLSESARVEGAVSADQVTIGGSVVGPVLAREILELQRTAQVQGDVRYKTLEMQPGAVVAGQLQPQIEAPPVIASPLAAAPDPAPNNRRTEPTEPTLDPNGSLDLE